MVDTHLANLSNQLMLGAVLLYVVTMVAYAGEIAFGPPPRRGRRAGAGQGPGRRGRPGDAAETADDRRRRGATSAVRSTGAASRCS